MKCIGCNEESKLLIKMSTSNTHNSLMTWSNIEFCRSCAFTLFKGHNTLKAGAGIDTGKTTYIIIKIYTEFKKYEPLKLIL